MDTLHCLLRIGGRLIDYFIMRCVSDRDDRAQKKIPEILGAWQTQLKDIGVSWSFWEMADGSSHKHLKKWKFESLNGEPSKALFTGLAGLDLASLLPQKHKAKAGRYLESWKEFWKLYVSISSNVDFTAETAKAWGTATRAWAKNLVGGLTTEFLYATDFITPYLHLFIVHIPHYLEVHGNIHWCCCQKLELANKNQHHYYLSCTQRRPDANKYILRGVVRRFICPIDVSRFEFVCKNATCCRQYIQRHRYEAHLKECVLDMDLYLD
jgi:hypothetical protein